MMLSGSVSSTQKAPSSISPSSSSQPPVEIQDTNYFGASGLTPAIEQYVDEKLQGVVGLKDVAGSQRGGFDIPSITVVKYVAEKGTPADLRYCHQKIISQSKELDEDDMLELKTQIIYAVAEKSPDKLSAVMDDLCARDIKSVWNITSMIGHIAKHATGAQIIETVQKLDLKRLKQNDRWRAQVMLENSQKSRNDPQFSKNDLENINDILRREWR